MLTINDLHREQELSSFEMRNVAGGEDLIALHNAEGQAAATLGNIFSTLGCSDAAQICFTAADCAGSAGWHHCL